MQRPVHCGAGHTTPTTRTASGSQPGCHLRELPQCCKRQPHSKIGAGIPSLSGLSTAYIKNALLAYKNGQRTGTLMPQLAKGYTDEQIHTLANYLGSPGKPGKAGQPQQKNQQAKGQP
ncbi:MAG: hypothetical protein HC848_09620 [Limnobacter sp.]|nr:hypothetical protein [Limnobacter sp.]